MQFILAILQFSNYHYLDFPEAARYEGDYSCMGGALIYASISVICFALLMKFYSSAFYRSSKAYAMELSESMNSPKLVPEV